MNVVAVPAHLDALFIIPVVHVLAVLVAARLTTLFACRFKGDSDPISPHFVSAFKSGVLGAFIDYTLHNKIN
jgi:hypothetical protein